MTTTDLLSRLDGVKARGAGKWVGRCPAHTDSNPSLSICEAGAKILLHCFCGCETLQIVAALELEMRDLFMDAPTPRRQHPTPRPAKVDRDALAFRFELAALDRRLRVQHVKAVIDTLSLTELSDSDQARVTTATARGEADLARAELFEGVADDLRWKASKERTMAHAPSY